MTAAATSQAPDQPTRPTPTTRVLALHESPAGATGPGNNGGPNRGPDKGPNQQGSVWRAVIAELAAGRPSAVAAQTIPAGDVDAARALADRHGVTAIIRVLPAAETVCRLVETPAPSAATSSPMSDVADALRLMAEAQLPASIPEHRRGVAVLGPGAAPGMQRGLLVGWSPPGSPAGQAAGHAAENDRSNARAAAPPPIDATRDRFTTEVAALAALVIQADPTDPAANAGPRLAAIARPGVGSLGVAATNGERAVVRATRLPMAADTHAVPQAALDSVRETAGVVGAADAAPHTPPADADGFLADPQTTADVRAALQRLVDRPEDASRFAIALGAAFGALRFGEQPGDAFGLRASATIEREPRTLRIARWLSSPKRAAALAAAAVLALLAAPLAAEAVRVALLESRLERVEAALGQAEQSATLDDQLVLYDALDTERMPMTKLLADAVAALPVENTDRLTLLETLEIDRQGSLSMTGVADAFALVGAIEDNLSSTQVFRNVSLGRTQRGEEPGSPVEFEISARVDLSYFDEPGLPNFAETTIADVLYGEDSELITSSAIASAETRIAPAGADAIASNAGTLDATPRSSGGAAARVGGGAGGSSTGTVDAASGDARADADTERRRPRFEGGRGAEPEPPTPVPDELTEAQIGEMDNIEAMKARLERSRALRERDDLDDATRTRLQREMEELMQRARDAKREGGS